MLFSIASKAQVGIYPNNNSLTPAELPIIDLAIGDNNTGIEEHTGTTTGSYLSLISDNKKLTTINPEGKVGVNNPEPTKNLSIDAKNTPIEIKNLASPASANSFIVVDNNNGDVGYRVNPASIAQFLRVGLSEKNTYPTGEQTLEIAPQGSIDNAPNGAKNEFNLITGSTVNYSTHTIKLPKGVYSISVKLVGYYEDSNNTNNNNNLDLIMYVDNQKYTTVKGGIAQNYVQARKTAELKEIIEIKNTADLKFGINVIQSPIHIYNSFPPLGSAGKSVRSSIIVNKLR